jgi:hypothetical protein
LACWSDGVMVKTVADNHQIILPQLPNFGIGQVYPPSELARRLIVNSAVSSPRHKIRPILQYSATPALRNVVIGRNIQL